LRLDVLRTHDSPQQFTRLTSAGDDAGLRRPGGRICMACPEMAGARLPIFRLSARAAPHRERRRCRLAGAGFRRQPEPSGPRRRGTQVKHGPGSAMPRRAQTIRRHPRRANHHQGFVNLVRSRRARWRRELGGGCARDHCAIGSLHLDRLPDGEPAGSGVSWRRRQRHR